MTVAEVELPALADVAAAVLDDAAEVFVAQLGAAEQVTKGIGDFATAADLEIERRVTAALTERTGLPVHGEEFGGRALAEGSTWVLDPVDGTANYSAGLPLAGINLALLTDGVPVLALTWLPLLDERYVAVAGGPTRRNGTELPRLERLGLDQATVALGHISPKVDDGWTPPYPFRYRMEVATVLAKRVLRVRLLGSSAVDHAWAAAGRLGAALSFGNHPWDNAPGALLVRSAGGVVADLEGGEYGLRSTSIVAGSPGVVEELVEVLAELGDPAGYA